MPVDRSTLRFEWSGFDGAAQDDYTPDGEGQTLSAYSDDTFVGYAQLIVVGRNQPNDWLANEYVPGDVYVAWIETDAAWRRKGIAAAIVEQIRWQFPDSMLVTGGFDSEAGEEFWNACIDD